MPWYKTYYKSARDFSILTAILGHNQLLNSSFLLWYNRNNVIADMELKADEANAILKLIEIFQTISWGKGLNPTKKITHCHFKTRKSTWKAICKIKKQVSQII